MAQRQSRLESYTKPSRSWRCRSLFAPTVMSHTWSHGSSRPWYFRLPATKTTKPTRSVVEIHAQTLRLAVMLARSPITRLLIRRTPAPAVKILVLPKGDTRMLESSFHSDNIAATNFLSSDNEV